MNEPSCFYNGQCMEGPDCPECSQIHIRRANDTALIHVMEDDYEFGMSKVDRVPRCGLVPSTTAPQLIDDGGPWLSEQKMTVRAAMDYVERWCPECLAKLKKEFDLPTG